MTPDRLRRVSLVVAAVSALVWLGTAPLLRVCDPQLAVDVAWLPTPGGELRGWLNFGEPGEELRPRDRLDPWGREWILSGFYFGSSSGAGWGVSVTRSLGPDGVDQDGKGDDLIVSSDQAAAQAAAAGRRPVGPPYTPPLAHWLLALCDQAGGVLALILAWLLLAERQLLRQAPFSVWTLAWLAPGPAVLVAWFAAHAWADLELQPALPTLVPGWVAAGATAGLLVTIGCGGWLRVLQPADATWAATARETAGALSQVARLPVDLVQLARQVLHALRVGHVRLPASSSAKGGVGVEAPRKEPPPCPPP